MGHPTGYPANYPRKDCRCILGLSFFKIGFSGFGPRTQRGEEVGGSAFAPCRCCYLCPIEMNGSKLERLSKFFQKSKELLRTIVCFSFCSRPHHLRGKFNKIYNYNLCCLLLLLYQFLDIVVLIIKIHMVLKSFYFACC